MGWDPVCYEEHACKDDATSAGATVDWASVPAGPGHVLWCRRRIPSDAEAPAEAVEASCSAWRQSPPFAMVQDASENLWDSQGEREEIGG